MICQNPHRTYNLGASHRDHRIVGGVAIDCVYPLARDHLSFPELMPDFEPHKVHEIHVMQWENPQLVVDITDVIDLKLKALACHASQFADFAGGREAHARARGRDRQAEGLRVRGDLRPDRAGAMIRYWPALLSVLLVARRHRGRTSRSCACPRSAITPGLRRGLRRRDGDRRSPRPGAAARWPTFVALALSGGPADPRRATSTSCGARVPATATVLRVGEPAPDFTLPDATGPP